MLKVSIVLPTLNGEKYIRQSIESCLNQTYSNLELIIVDGGSTDGTLDVINEIRDARIRLVHQPPNSGRLPGALNLGFRETIGEFLT
jgi:glycosyltransferase involved in cell wall biosynthesis